MNTPCKDCKLRQIGCHGNCDDYKEYKIKLDEIKNNDSLKREKEYLSYLCKRSHVWAHI